MIEGSGGVREARGGGRPCPMCGGPSVPGSACPTCGFKPSLRKAEGPRRDSGRRLWIALGFALVALLLSFCLLYALVRTLRVR